MKTYYQKNIMEKLNLTDYQQDMLRSMVSDKKPVSLTFEIGEGKGRR